MIIALIVQSIILLALILALIFSKDFRVDVLASSNDNQAEFKGIKIRGAMFWVIYAITAIGTITIAMEYESKPTCEPVLSAVDTDQWVALDVKNAKPIALKYGCADQPRLEDHKDKSINMDLKLNSEFNILGAVSNYDLGALDKQSLKDLQLTNDLKIDRYIEIYYNLQLQPL